MSARDEFNTLAPEFAVKVNGALLPNDAVADVHALTVLDDVDAPGMFTLTLSAWDSVEMNRL